MRGTRPLFRGIVITHDSLQLTTISHQLLSRAFIIKIYVVEVRCCLVQQSNFPPYTVFFYFFSNRTIAWYYSWD